MRGVLNDIHVTMMLPNSVILVMSLVPPSFRADTDIRIMSKLPLYEFSTCIPLDIDFVNFSFCIKIVFRFNSDSVSERLTCSIYLLKNF